MGDEDRDAILRRRSKLVAIALAGLTSTTACGVSSPQPCLTPMQVEPDPGPCLSDVVDEEPEQREPESAPVPCLSVAPSEDETETE